MQTLVERGCGLDVHQATVVACLLIVLKNGQVHRQMRTFDTKPLMAFFGKLQLDAISAGQVERFKLARARTVSPAGTNRDLAALRFMLNFAIRQGHIDRNPVSEVRFFPEGPGVMRVVSHEEQGTYLGAASPLLRDIATLILETGMRPEEVFTMRKENVHIDRGYLFVPAGKTPFARRNILIDPQGNLCSQEKVTRN